MQVFSSSRGSWAHRFEQYDNDDQEEDDDYDQGDDHVEDQQIALLDVFCICVLTYTSTNKYQKYKLVESGDQLVEDVQYDNIDKKLQKMS